MKAIYKISFCVLLFFTTCIYADYSPPELQAGGVLSFTSERGITDMVTITISGSDYLVDVMSNGSAKPTLTFSIASVSQFRYLNMEMGTDMMNIPPTLYREMSHYQEYSKKVKEMSDFLNLVRYSFVTIKTVTSGDWSSGSTWEGGIVPPEGSRVLIESGHTVLVDSDIEQTIRTIRVDGTLKFSTTANSSLKVDTIIGVMGSEIEMGTAISPIPEGITAKLIIEDQGDFVNNNPSDPDYDPSHLGLGLIAHGTTKMYGMERTGYATYNNALVGATSVTLDKLPTDWKIGDKIVFAGSSRNAIEDEARVITGLGGRSVSFKKQLLYDHVLPKHTKEGLVLKMHVINLTRNVIIMTQEGSYRTIMDGPEPKSRGHVMFMHTNNVELNYVGFYELGRTNKLQTMVNMARDDEGNITRIAHNPIARYPCHFHRTGTDGTSFGIVKGSVVDGSVGWGFVNHRGAAYIDNNVAYDVDGASFVAEVGNEIGTFINNVSIRTLGNNIENFTGDPGFFNADKTEINVNEFGSAGDGFWIHSHTVLLKDNVASGFTGNGFQFWNQSIDGVDRRLDPTKGIVSRADYLEGNGFLMKNSYGYGGNILYSPNFTISTKDDYNTGLGHQIENLVGWGIKIGIRRKYNKATIYDNLVLIGDLDNPIGAAGFNTHSNGKGVVFYKPHVEGFIEGFKLEHNGGQQGIYGGYFNNIYNIYVAKRHTRPEYSYYIDNTFGILSEEALNRVKLKLPSFKGQQLHYIGIPDTGAFDVLEEEVVVSKDGKISNHMIKHNGVLYKSYLEKEQHPDSIPPVDISNFGTQTNAQRLASGNILRVFGQEMYDPSAVFKPDSPEINFTNLVLGPASNADLSNKELRDVPKTRIVEFTIEVGATKQLLISDYFDRIFDDASLEFISPISTDEVIATAQLNGSATLCTINGLVVGETEIILETTNKGKVNIKLNVVATLLPPIANSDNVIVDYNLEKRFNVLHNDVSINKENGLSITVNTPPSQGTIIVNSDKTISYTPNMDTSGSDSFTYTIEDFVGAVSVPGTVNITVSPAATDYNITVLKGETVSIDTFSTISLVGDATNGATSFSGSTLTYTHNNSPSLIDSFMYEANAQHGTITITISDTTIANVAPIANPGTAILVNDDDNNGSEQVNLSGVLSTDLVGTIVEYRWDISGVAASPFYGITPTVTLDKGNYIATLTVTDDGGLANQAEVEIEVEGRKNMFFEAETSSDTESNKARASSSAVDGDEGRPWQSALNNLLPPKVPSTIPERLFIRLEEPYLIEEIEYFFSNTASLRSSNWKLYVSLDEINYTVIDETNVDVGANYSVTFNPPIAGQFFRFEFLEHSSHQDVRIQEIKAYGNTYPNILPIANAGIDKTYYDEDELGNEDGYKTIVLDGSESIDEDDHDLSFYWTSLDGSLEFYENSPTATLPIGEHQFILTVTDIDGETDQDQVTITIDNGTENIALFKSVFGTGLIVNPSFELINDNRESTLFSHTEGLPGFVGINLGSIYTLNNVVLNWETDNYGVDYDIETSIDGVNWVLHATETANSSLYNNIDISGVIAQYIRVKVLSSITSNSFGISEFEVYKQNMANSIPIAKAGSDVSVSDILNDGFEQIELNAGLSSDLDGSIVNYKWDVEGYASLYGITSTINLPIGVSTVTLTVTDNNGATASDDIIVEVLNDLTVVRDLFLFDFENNSSGQIEPLRTANIEVVDNPESSSINPSTKVLKVVLEGSGLSDPLGNRTSSLVGLKIPFLPEVTPGLRYLHMKIRASYSNVNNAVQTRGTSSGNNASPNLRSDAIAEWQDFVFDLGSDTYDLYQLQVWLNRQIEPADGWNAETIYIDDIYLSNTMLPFDGIANMAPIARSENYSAIDADEDGKEEVILNASTSEDLDNEILYYKWTIPEIGVFTSASPIMHIDIPVGNHEAILEVTDVSDAVDYVDFSITVASSPTNNLPIANAGSDQFIHSTSESMVTLNAMESEDLDGEIIGYTWKIPGLGTYNGITANVVLPTGTYGIELIVTDNDGAIAEDIVMITLSDNIAPEANAGEDILVFDTDNSGTEEIVLDANHSFDSNYDIVSYNWSIPTIGVVTGSSPTVNLPVGAHTITLTVTDVLGNTDTDIVTVSISASPTIIIGSISGNTAEDGSSATFNISLSTEPTAAVTVSLSSSDVGEGIVTTTVNIPAASWNTGVEVTVTGVADDMVDGDINYSIITGNVLSDDENYNVLDGSTIADVSVVNTDVNIATIAAVIVDPISGNTAEDGTSATFNLSLSSEPTAAVTVSLSSSDVGEGIVPATVNIPAAYWNTGVEVTVTGVSDDTVDGDINYSIISGNVSSVDENYNVLDGSTIADVSVVNTDINVAAVIVGSISGNTAEDGTSATFNLSLSTEPTATVTVSLFSSNTAEGVVPATVSIPAISWNTGVEVTITGVDDTIVDGDIDYEISFIIISTDVNYNGLVIDDLPVFNKDDDELSIKVSDAIGSKNGERMPWIIGGLADYTVNYLKVFNRYGRVVFETKNYQNNWTGVYKNNSKSLPEGSYFYHIELVNDEGSTTKSGWIYIFK